jgi:hypothetical protein
MNSQKHRSIAGWGLLEPAIYRPFALQTYGEALSRRFPSVASGSSPRMTNEADQEARSSLTVILPVPAQALQMIRSPRTRTRPVPQHRTQVCWRGAAGRLLWIENRFPKSIRISFVL